MVVPPGYSISDLIQALVQIKVVYDAFFDEYANSETLMRDLADEIGHFCEQLEQHKEVVESRGLKYSRYDAVNATLKSCRRFLEHYKALLDQGRRRSILGAYKTARFPFVQDEVGRLQKQMERHKTDFILSLVIDKPHPESFRNSPNAISAPIPIPGQHLDANSPNDTRLSPASTPLAEQPHGSISPPSPSHIFQDQYSARLTESPSKLSRDHLVSQSPPSTEPPSLSGISRRSETSRRIPELVLPQPALTYRVAKVFFSNGRFDLRRKPVGRDVLNGREVVVIDEYGNPRFRHHIRMSSNEACYPYTWHRKWRGDHDAFEIDFIGTMADAHSIFIKGDPATSSKPKYIFTEARDFQDFQSQLRGKQLEATFDVRRIACATSTRIAEATDQHLKIWKSYRTQEYSLSFYANAARCPQHVEYPFTILEQQTTSDDDSHVRISFIKSREGKNRTLFKRFSITSSERRRSSDTSTAPTVFTRNNTDITSDGSLYLTSTSMTSNTSMQSERSSHIEYPATGESLESQAKTMKWLDIEFFDDTEASRFKQLYTQIFPEEIKKSDESIINWGMNAERHTNESMTSTSPNGTPFTMSPELRPRQSLIPNQDH